MGFVGTNPDDLPAGVTTGGVRTADLVAHGGVYTMDNTTKVVNTSLVGGVAYANNLVEAGNALQLDTAMVEGTACPLVGQQARDASGALVSCINPGTGPVWTKAGLVTGVLGAACAPEGGIAQDISDNTLYCHAGIYQLFKNFVPLVVDNAGFPVTHGQVVTKPVCGTGGTPTLWLGNGISQTGSTGILNVYSLDNGSSWTVQITTDAGVEAGPAPVMQARTSCNYS
jgi:hypothetical protein